MWLAQRRRIEHIRGEVDGDARRSPYEHCEDAQLVPRWPQSLGLGMEDPKWAHRTPKPPGERIKAVVKVLLQSS